MDQSIERQVRHIKDGFDTAETVQLVVEEPLEIRVNGTSYAVVMRTPGHEVELAAGFCLTEGVIDSYKEIIHIGFCAEAGENAENVLNVLTDVAEEGSGGLFPRRNAARTLPSRSGCGICGIRMLDDLKLALPSLEGGPVVEASALVRMQYSMLEHQKLFKSTWGGTHAAMLAQADGELIVVREDVGRHNAMDKVIGYALQNGIDCRDCVVFLSSRISFEMVQKAVRAGISLVAAVSAATSLAVELADRIGCTLVGRLRDRDMVIYTNPHRINVPPS